MAKGFCKKTPGCAVSFTRFLPRKPNWSHCFDANMQGPMMQVHVVYVMHAVPCQCTNGDGKSFCCRCPYVSFSRGKPITSVFCTQQEEDRWYLMALKYNCNFILWEFQLVFHFYFFSPSKEAFTKCYSCAFIVWWWRNRFLLVYLFLFGGGGKGGGGHMFRLFLLLVGLNE